MTTKKYKVKHCKMTCSACPSQWNIYTDEGEYIYARYRWGRLTITLNPWREGSKELYCEDIGDGLDGVMETTELVEYTKSVLDWSKLYG